MVSRREKTRIFRKSKDARSPLSKRIESLYHHIIPTLLRSDNMLFITRQAEDIT